MRLTVGLCSIIFQGCRNNRPQTACFKLQTSFFSRLWRPEAQSQGWQPGHAPSEGAAGESLPLPSYLYQIAHLGDDDEEPEFSSAMPLEEGDTFFFQPRPLKNLVLVDELDSLSPILFCQVRIFLVTT